MGDGVVITGSKPDLYQTVHGTERIRLEPRPAVIPRSLEELVIHLKGEI